MKNQAKRKGGGTRKVQQSKDKIEKKIVRKSKKPRCPAGTRPVESKTIAEEFSKHWPERGADLQDISDQDLREMTMMQFMLKGCVFKGPSHRMNRNGVLFEIIPCL